MRQRAKKIFECFGGATKPDAILLDNGAQTDPAFLYATGFDEGEFHSCTAVLHSNGSVKLFAPKLEEQLAFSQAKKFGGIEVVTVQSGRDLVQSLKEDLKGCGLLGLNYAHLTHSSFRKISKQLGTKTVDASEAIRKARVVKDAEEIERISKACSVTTNTLKKLIDGGAIEKGVSENELAAEINYAFHKQGAREAFPSICAFGANSAVPHHPTGNSRLKTGDFVKLDFGCSWKKYCADFTRTMVFGKKSKKQERMLQVVAEAQDAALDEVGDGVIATKVHEAAAKVIDASEFRGKFIHSTGHSLGLEVHDGYSLSSENWKLETGAVLTVEPGVYVEGVGGVRIEDVVVVEKTGYRKLTSFVQLPEL